MYSFLIGSSSDAINFKHSGRTEIEEHFHKLAPLVEMILNMNVVCCVVDICSAVIRMCHVILLTWKMLCHTLSNYICGYWSLVWALKHSLTLLSVVQMFDGWRKARAVQPL